MRKKIWIYSLMAIPLIAIVLLFSFGLQIGNVRIGKQIDQVKQSKAFTESLFAKDYFNQDKLTVINTWATWCAPCIDEMPTLNNVMSEHKGTPVNFISLSVDKDTVKLKKFNNQAVFKFKDVTMPNLTYRKAILNTLEGRSPEEWISSNTVPVTYFVKNGKVLHKQKGVIEEMELKKLIALYQ